MKDTCRWIGKQNEIRTKCRQFSRKIINSPSKSYKERELFSKKEMSVDRLEMRYFFFKLFLEWSMDDLT
jgi:hypothetical protein